MRAAGSTSIAPSAANVAWASATWRGGGASGSGRPTAPGVPHAATSSMARVRSATAISGAGQASRPAHSDSPMQRTARPEPRRAARPARCSADDRAHDVVTRPDIPRPTSSRGPRDRQASTTARTPGTVNDDSAMAVETMMRRGPSGEPPRMTRSCSSPRNWPWRARISTPRAPEPVEDARSIRSSAPMTCSTSRTPGTKTRTSPSPGASRRAAAACRATWSRNGQVTPRWSSRATGDGAHRTSSGCSTESAATMGAGAPGDASSPAKRGASTVADIATSVMSSRSSRRSRSMPSRMSESRLRSCTSSRMTAETPGRSPSRSKRRVITPGVANSTDVSRETLRSPRTVYPTAPPSSTPANSASRRAAARTATRRGAVTITRPGRVPSARARSATTLATTGGTTVVLPVPGGACTTATRPSSARASSPADAVNGRPAPMAGTSNTGDPVEGWPVMASSMPARPAPGPTRRPAPGGPPAPASGDPPAPRIGAAAGHVVHRQT